MLKELWVLKINSSQLYFNNKDDAYLYAAQHLLKTAKDGFDSRVLAAILLLEKGVIVEAISRVSHIYGISEYCFDGYELIPSKTEIQNAAADWFLNYALEQNWIEGEGDYYEAIVQDRYENGEIFRGTGIVVEAPSVEVALILAQEAFDKIHSEFVKVRAIGVAAPCSARCLTITELRSLGAHVPDNHKTKMER